jgi:predicted MFS family arabinose efflux permease
MMTVETAASRPGLLPYALSAGNFAIGMGAFVVIGLIPPLAERFALSAAEAGRALTVYAVAYAVGSPLLVALTGGWDRRAALLTGLGLFLAAALWTALARSPTELWAARALAACGAGLFTPVSAAVAAAAAAPERRGAALSTVFFGLTFAQVAGVPAGAFLGYAYGWATAFWAVAGLTALGLGAVAALTPRGLPFTAASLGTLGAALRDGPAMLAALFTASFLGAIYVLYTYLAPLLEARMGWGRDGVSATLAAFGIGAVAGNLLGGRLSDRIGPARTLLLLCAGQAALLPLWSFLPLPGAAVLGLATLWSVFGWSFMAPQQARLIARAPERAGVMLSINAASIYLGASLGSALGGLLLARFGVDALGVAAAAAMGFAALHLLVSERLR